MTHFLKKELYIHNKFVTEKWVNRCHFFLDEKNVQKISPAGEVSSD